MQKNYGFRAIAFDMDGVIIDSNSEIEKFWTKWAKVENIPFTDETAPKFIHGRTTIETIEELFQKSTEEKRREIGEAALAFDMNMRPALIAGAGIFLPELYESISKIALVTSAPLKRAKAMLDLHGLQKYLPYSITGEDVKSGKPDPEPYIKASVKMETAPGDCLVFEDSDNGILSALAAGMNVIAVNNNEIKSERIISVISDYTHLNIEENILIIDDLLIELIR